VEWGVPPLPEWYDHYLDVHWGWQKSGSGFFVERGVFGSLALSPDATVLELCCGDGFNARHFYAPRAERVVAVDFDPSAIAFARRHNAHPRVEYVCADIRTAMPGGRFTNVTLDGALEHFTESEIGLVLAAVDERLAGHGLFSGYTIVELDVRFVHHEREFAGKDDLMGFLAQRFKRACVFETVHPTRTNLYWYASQGAPLPLASDDPGVLWHRA
jgi:cyclopropane fatty-acyl-phospholipid synthase-like methyltransferase